MQIPSVLSKIPPERLTSILKLLGATGAGAGVSAAENAYLGDFLPDELKTINLGIGAGTGAAALMGGKPALTGALLSLPLKQMALLGIGSVEKGRRQQRDLMGLELDRAKTDLSAATKQHDSVTKQLQDRGLRNRLAALGVISALTAAGAGTYYAVNQRKKPRKKTKTDTLTKGQPSRSRDKLRIKIDVPAGAAPQGLLDSLMNLDDNTQAFTQYASKKAFFNVLS